MQNSSNVQLAVSLPYFDGPFDLLLSLIRRNEYSMDNLPIVAITGQFLDYIHKADELDMDLGGEFIDTASWLVLLKSRSILPQESGAEAQRELREAVQKYQVDREELDQTKKKLRRLRTHRERAPAPAAAHGRRVEEVDEEAAPTAAEVVKRLRSAIASARAAAAFSVGEAVSATVAEQQEWILAQISQFPTGTPFSTEPWFADQTNSGARISLFLALLELCRTGELLVHQCRDFGSIYVKSLNPDRAIA